MEEFKRQVRNYETILERICARHDLDRAEIITKYDFEYNSLKTELRKRYGKEIICNNIDEACKRESMLITFNYMFDKIKDLEEIQ